MNARVQVTGLQVGKTRYPRYDAAVLGFKEYWYPVLMTHQLRRRPLSLTLFGERLVFVRDGERVYALHDRCPHRGVRLSEGRREFPGTITCPYHGWTFALESGVLVAALTDGPDSPTCGKARVKSYPVAERAGIVWIYYGDKTPPPVEEDIPEEFLKPDAAIGGRVTVRKGDWRYAAENGFDEGHGKYLHRRALIVAFKHLPAWILSDVEHRDGGWITRLPKAHAFQSDYPGLGRWPKKHFWKKSRILSKTSIRLPCTLKVDLGEYFHFEWYVPTAPGEHRYLQFVLKNTSWAGRVLFKLRYWIYMRWLLHVWFNNEDASIVEMMDTPPEQLYRPDSSIIGWRKLCEGARGADAAREA